ncbi:hypothetical protein RKD54_004716 [Pseudarthrobacter sp. SLBN-100]
MGATGAILSLRVAKDLARRDLELGIVTTCIGGGQALAALFRPGLLTLWPPLMKRAAQSDGIVSLMIVDAFPKGARPVAADLPSRF